MSFSLVILLKIWRSLPPANDQLNSPRHGLELLVTRVIIIIEFSGVSGRGLVPTSRL